MLIKAVQLILSLSILVFIHELGHFIAARTFKTRVEKFYLFFDFLFPVPTLWNFALFKKKIGDTEYGIGWFPLGGYVKIAGMIDETMDDTFLGTPPQPYEYRAKKNWQKLIIMLGGIFMNLVLAWFIYSQILFWQGKAVLPAENAKYGISCDSTGLYAGFRDGDIILSHDGGKKFESFASVIKELLLDDVKTVEVLRNGQPYTFTVPSDFVEVAIASRDRNAIDFRFPAVVGQIAEQNVIQGKLQKGDIIIGLNDSVIHYFQEAPAVLAKLKNQDVTITFLRGNDTLKTSAKVPSTGLLGFRPPEDMQAYFKVTTIHFNLVHSFTHGATITYKTLIEYIRQLETIFRNKGYKQLGGVGTMGSLFPEKWDWLAFWNLTAFLSIILAVMNLLPIPMLDGGYVLLLLFEMITGKQLSEKSVEYINRVGFVILIFLILYANGMDIFRAFFAGAH